MTAATDTRRANAAEELKELAAEQAALQALIKLEKRNGRPTQELHLAIQELGRRRRRLEGWT